MKKLLLTSLICVTAITTFAQAVVTGISPASIQGNYDFGVQVACGAWPGETDDGTWGSTQDSINFNVNGTFIQDTLMLVEDGTPGVNPQGVDSTHEGCNPLINDLNGKIAVIYRNTCEFGAKVLNAQDAGAVAAIIVNRENALVGMLGGVGGVNVHIPAVFLSSVDGNRLIAEMQNGPVVMFIGNRIGAFGNDIGAGRESVMRAENAATPRQLAMSSADFSVDMGARVTNYGVNDQTNVTVTATVEYGGSVVYTQSTTPVDLSAGSDTLLMLPTFSEPTYDVGYYDVTYAVTSDSVDDFSYDNVIEADFQISDHLLSLGQLDSNMVPQPGVFYRGVNTGTNVDFTTCMHFRDSLASRIQATGMYFAASGGMGDSLTGTYVQLFAYEWSDVFTDVNDAAYNPTSLLLNQVASGEYDYLADLQQEFVYGQLNSLIGGPLTMTDNTRYLFCVATNTEGLYVSHDGNADYTLNREVYAQPLGIVQVDLGWNANGFGPDVVPSTAITVTGVNSIEEIEAPTILAYPNPTGNLVTLRSGTNLNLSSISIMDITGNLVKKRAINNNGSATITLDVNDLANGQYIFVLTEENGRSSHVKVTIAK